MRGQAGPRVERGQWKQGSQGLRCQWCRAGAQTLWAPGPFTPLEMMWDLESFRLYGFGHQYCPQSKLNQKNVFINSLKIINLLHVNRHNTFFIKVIFPKTKMQ